MAKAKKKLRRFYRGKLETMVWDPKKGCVLVDFMEQEPKGTYTTDDPYKIKVLVDKGYIEVGLDQEYPPELPPDPVRVIRDVKPVHEGMTEEAAALAISNKSKRDAALAKAKEDEHGPAVDPPTTKVTTKKPKRAIKRRSKK